MSLAEAFAPAEAAHKARVMASTWGHLMPTSRVRHPFEITFCESEYGDDVIIKTVFSTCGDSPWLYRAMQDFVFGVGRKIEPGTVYTIRGWFKTNRRGDFIWQET